MSLDGELSLRDDSSSPAEAGPGAGGGDGRIVVGVDGSEASLAALQWAEREAHRNGAHLQVVLVYHPDPYLDFAFGDYPAVNPMPLEQASRDARTKLRAALAAAVPAARKSAVELIPIADVAAAKALIRQARGANMLVIGGNHHHGLGILLGSTATSCVRQAPCPVVVVPAGVGTPQPLQAPSAAVAVSL